MIKKHILLISLLALASCDNSDVVKLSFYECIHKSLLWSEALTLNYDEAVASFPDSIEVYFRGDNVIADHTDQDGTIAYKDGIAEFHFHYDTKGLTTINTPTYINKSVISATIDGEPFEDTYNQVESRLRSFDPIESIKPPFHALREFVGSSFAISETETENCVDYYYSSVSDTDYPGRYMLSSETKAVIEEAGLNQFGRQLYKATFPDTGFVIPTLIKTYVTSEWYDVAIHNFSGSIGVNVDFYETDDSLIREDTFSYEGQDYKTMLEITEFGLTKRRSRNFDGLWEMWCEYE